MKMEQKRDLAAGLVLFLAALVLYFVLIPGFVTEGPPGSGLSPRFFPTVASVLLGVLSLGLVFASLPSRAAGGVKAEHEGAAGGVGLQAWLGGIKWRPIASILVMALYFPLFEHLGFLWGTPVAICLLMLVFGQTRWSLIVITSLATTGILFVMFEYGLNVPLS